MDEAGIEDADRGGVETRFEDGGCVVAKALDSFLPRGFKVDEGVEVGAEEAVGGGVRGGGGGVTVKVMAGDSLAL